MSTSSHKSVLTDDISANANMQALSIEDALNKRIRASAAVKGWKQADLAAASGVPIPRINDYWNGPKQPNATYLFAIANALNVSAEWLALGKVAAQAGGLVDATDADWIGVPKYDLRHIADKGLGEPTLTVPMRKDWLYANFRVSSDLWLTKLLAEYRPAGLTEDMMVVCRTVARNDLSENHICLWRYEDSIVVGRYSVQPDALLARGLSREGLPLGSVAGIMGASVREGVTANAIMGYDRPDLRDLIVSPSQIGEGDGYYHLVGRILGVFIRPI